MFFEFWPNILYIGIVWPQEFHGGIHFVPNPLKVSNFHDFHFSGFYKQFFMIFNFQVFTKNGKTSKMSENFIARQNRSVKMTATTNRTIWNQHPDLQNPKKSKKQTKTGTNFEPFKISEIWSVRPDPGTVLIATTPSIRIWPQKKISESNKKQKSKKRQRKNCRGRGGRSPPGKKMN